MRVQDVMTKQVTGTTPQAGILQALKLMVDHRISGLPVLDANCRVIGMLTEGDLLRRAELGTAGAKPGWLSFLTSSGKLAEGYVHTHGRTVEEVMSHDPVTVAAGASLEEAVELMEKYRVRRLPVTAPGGEAVGIIARSDIVRALFNALPQQAVMASDAEIGAAILAGMKGQAWVGLDSVRVDVRDGVVELDGTIVDERQRIALRVLAENTPGVRQVVDHLVWIEPMSGLVMMPPGDADEQAEVQSSTAA